MMVHMDLSPSQGTNSYYFVLVVGFTSLDRDFGFSALKREGIRTYDSLTLII